MSNHKDNVKNRKNDHLLKNLPTEVLLKARSTLVSLSGALKPKHDQQEKPKLTKQEESKDKKNDRLKSSRSEPEFSEIRKNKHRSRINGSVSREYVGGLKPRPLSVGAMKRYEKESEDYQISSFSKDISPIHHRQYESSEDVCVQSRLVIPVVDRLSNQDITMHDTTDRPRKKLSFREPEIISSGSATVGRSHKLMGVNSLTRKPNRVSLRSDVHSSSLEGQDSDLESQAMRIVRTVGQAFEVCHKMQINTPEDPIPSTSSAIDDHVVVDDPPNSKEAASDCGASESCAASTSKAADEGAVGGDVPTRPTHLDLLPPPPRKEGKRSPQRVTPAPSINLPELPECVTKVELTVNGENAESTPLSAQHQLQLLRERLDQQAQQTRAAVAQLLLLRDQLAAEQSARCEAQARTHQLLVHNKELIEHIAALVAHLQERERGSTKPISAQQLTLLPQNKAKEDGGVGETAKANSYSACNGDQQPLNTDTLVNLITQTNKVTQNVENNNVTISPFSLSPTKSAPNGSNSALNFDGMTNEQIQSYLISKLEDLGGFPDDNTDPNPQFYQNCKAFPNIPPLKSHFSNADLANLLNHKIYQDLGGSTDKIGAQAMSVGQSENSLYSNSQPTTSKDSSPDDDASSDDGIPFIMPLSHNGTLTATSEDGRVKLIVPVSPSESASDVAEAQPEAQSSSGMTLKVPESLAPGAPITRTTSEKVPNRSEMMAAMRSQWTRHTTK